MTLELFKKMKTLNSYLLSGYDIRCGSEQHKELQDVMKHLDLPKDDADFWLKIHMRDWLWDAMNDNDLDKLDKFEAKLNRQIHTAFRNYLTTGKIEING
jgi:hypothetical protein